MTLSKDRQQREQDKFTGTSSETTAVKTSLVDSDGETIGVQYPLSTDGDSVYVKDLWLDSSTSVNFSGDVTDLFNNLHSEITNITSDDPKTLFIHFNRTVVCNTIGLGSATSGDFSNVKIEIYNSGDVASTVIDESSSSTKYTSRTFQLPVTAGFNALKITFHTSDTVTLSNCVILKTLGVVARLQATKPDNTVTDINATTGGNLKVSMEELESGISVNSNSQLRTTLYDEAGNPYDSHLGGDGAYHMGVDAVISGNQNPDRVAWITPLNALAIAPDYRLVGTSFSGTVKDTNFWTETVTNGGTVTRPGGYVTLETNTTANATALYETVSKGRFVSGYPNMFTALPSWETAGTTDNVRRIGAYTTTDGFFVQLDGTVFSVGSRKAGVDSLTNSGSFNGNMGTDWTPTAGTYYKINIEYTPKGVFYYVDNVLLHKNGTALLTNSLTLGVTMENVNDNGSISDVIFNCIAGKVSREGQLHTDPTYKYITGAATTVLKYNAGSLHTIVNNNNAGSCIVYDNTAGSGTIIASIDLAKVLGTLTFDAPFSNGLTVVTVGSAVITVMYE